MFRKSIRLYFFIAIIAAFLFAANIGTVGASYNRAVNRVATTTSCAQLTKFSSGNFINPTGINNLFYPLVPGTQYTLTGTTSEGAHTVIFTVTDLTKVINGVTTRVLWDQDIQDGELAESELAFQAQDKSGNVWVMGEYPEEYEGGVFTGAPSTWISGIDKAKAGVLVPGNPSLGRPAFIEGKSLSIDFWDCGQVYAKNQSVSVPSGNYSNVLVINEWDARDPSGGIQQKFYAPGIGVAQIGAINDPEAETLSLVAIDHLNPGQLAAVRKEALKLDAHGYEVSDIYAQTQPAQ